MMPVLDADGNEKFALIKISIPRGSRSDGTFIPYDGYAAADAYATWCMVLGAEGAQKLILSDAALEGYLISAAEDGSMEEWVSPGFALTTSR